MGIDALRLLEWQLCQRRVQLLKRQIALVDLLRRLHTKNGGAFDTVAAIQGVKRLGAVGTQIRRLFIIFKPV